HLLDPLAATICSIVCNQRSGHGGPLLRFRYLVKWSSIPFPYTCRNWPGNTRKLTIEGTEILLSLQ
ncbi:MAG: hypothetical protein ACLP3B_04075, partial [Syntrophobacteraceae bacterium]